MASNDLVDQRNADELRMLRARAYGPDADIDAAALERLRELESPEGPRAVLPLGADPPGVLPDESGEEHVEEMPSHPVPPRRVRPYLAAAAALVAVVIATAAITQLVVREVEADPLTVATLSVDPELDLTGMFGPAENAGIGFEDFYGITPISPPAGLIGRGDQSCLVLTPTARLVRNGGGFEGIGFYNCGAGGFPATVQFTVTREGNLPTQLLERFGEGTALRFILEGTRIVVLSDQE